MLTVKELIDNLQLLINDKNITEDNEIGICHYDEENNTAKFMNIINISKHSSDKNCLVTLNIDLDDAPIVHMPPKKEEQNDKSE